VLGAVRRAPQVRRKKNTGDLQWKIGANCNARPCDSERKAAGATTMENNGKNNAQNNGNRRTSGRVLTSGRERSRSYDVAARGRWRPNEKSPPGRAGDNSHKSETRISAIADFARQRKRKKKALPLFPRRVLSRPGASPNEKNFPQCRHAYDHLAGGLGHSSAHAAGSGRRHQDDSQYAFEGV
jgi:hypothetical protein